MLQVTGYHTLEDRDDVDSVESNGPIKCTSRKAWLGHGYYFWDSNIEWAHEWGTQYEEYVIYEAKLKINEKTFDLYGSVNDRITLVEWMKTLIGTNLVPKETITVGKVIEYMKKNIGFDKVYDSIRAFDQRGERIYLTFGGRFNEKILLTGERVQHCLINKNNLVSQTFKAIYPDHYK